MIDLGGPEEVLVDHDMIVPVEIDVFERQLQKFLYGMVFAGGDHVILGLVLLQHHPHRADVIAGEAPVAFGVQVAHMQFLHQAELDLRDAVADLARDEFLAASWTLVVEEDAGNGEEVVAFPVVDGDVVPVNLRDPVGAARVKGRFFGLRHFLDLAEHLAAGGLVEPGLGADQAHGFQQAGHADRREFARQGRLAPGGRDKRHGRQVEDFVGPGFFQHLDHGLMVQQVGLEQGDAVLDMGDAVEVLGARAPHHAENPVSFLQQKIGQIGSVLPGNACNQWSSHARVPFLMRLIPPTLRSRTEGRRQSPPSAFPA